MSDPQRRCRNLCHNSSGCTTQNGDEGGSGQDNHKAEQALSPYAQGWRDGCSDCEVVYDLVAADSLEGFLGEDFLGGAASTKLNAVLKGKDQDIAQGHAEGSHAIVLKHILAKREAARLACMLLSPAGESRLPGIISKHELERADGYKEGFEATSFEKTVNGWIRDSQASRADWVSRVEEETEA